MDADFRPARDGDEDALFRLSLPFMRSGELVVRDRAFYARRVRDFRVVELAGAIAACAATRPVGHRVEILNVVVGPHWQGLGVGGFLLERLVAELRAAGARELLVFSRTTTAWFVRHGFHLAEPQSLPRERLAMNDPARGSLALVRRIGAPATSCGATVGGGERRAPLPRQVPCRRAVR